MSEPPTRNDAPTDRRILGVLLLEAEAITAEGLKLALQAQQRTGERIGDAAIRIGMAGEEIVYETLARQLDLPFVAGPLEPEASALSRVREAFARHRKVLPLSDEGRYLHVATADPLDLITVDDLQFQSGKRVRVGVTTPSALRDGLDLAYGESLSAAGASSQAHALPGPPANEPRQGSTGGLDHLHNSSVVQIVDSLIRRAIDRGSSDLHVEQGPDDLRIRERVDGVLHRVTELPPSARASLLSRIKVVAGMDISVKRKPQDGGFPLAYRGRTLSVRVSTIPVEGGEKAVLRFLDPRSAPADLEALGLAAADLARVRALTGGGRGVVLAAGPTGSGKSSTLFGALGELNRTAVNVVTLEDPIEYRVRGVNQVQMNPRSGLTFPTALRAVLRQDPDVIMVGEIRDRETAEIAMSAAITGHLVLSTIHTVDAASGVSRLLQMGVPPHLVAGGLAGIIAQRLVRCTCSHCKGAPTGCGQCHEGYRGRTGVFQVLSVTEAMRAMIGRLADSHELRRKAEEAGMGTMADDARRKVNEGITTLQEVSRVLRDDPGEGLPCPACGAGLPSGGLGCPHCGRAHSWRCRCGRALRSDWRFCPDCLQSAGPMG